MLVTGTEYDGTYTWYQVNYNGTDGYVRSDMCQMLTIAELQRYLAEAASATPVPNGNHSGPSTTPNKNNNTSVTINGTPLKDLLPTDNSWSSGTGTAMPELCDDHARSERYADPGTRRQPGGAAEQRGQPDGQQRACRQRNGQVHRLRHGHRVEHRNGDGGDSG